MILMNDFVSMINGMKVGLEHSSQINLLLVIIFFLVVRSFGLTHYDGGRPVISLIEGSLTKACSPGLGLGAPSKVSL